MIVRVGFLFSFMGRLVQAGTPVTFPVGMTFELF